MGKGVVAGVVAVACLVGACSSSSPTGVAGKSIQTISTKALPQTLAGLDVHVEGVKNLLAETQNSYVGAVGLYSLRQNNLVIATLQISKLTDKFDYKSEKQRSLLASKVGGARPELHRLGSQTVYLTQGLRQSLSVWFYGRYLFILSARQDFDKPRTLLREAVAIQP